MHFLLQALRDRDRRDFSIYLAELLLAAGAEQPDAEHPHGGRHRGCDGHRGRHPAQESPGLRAMMGIDPSLSPQLECNASEQEQVVDALLSLPGCPPVPRPWSWPRCKAWSSQRSTSN